jgi:hypothetical protein
MGVLKSARFLQGDSATVNRLEDCANGRPSEVASHFTLGAKGTPVIQLQEALKAVQQNNPGLAIPPFVVNGVYDQAFANAVLQYKKKRDIRNFANNFDNIVGIKTIRSLDSETAPKTNPPAKPFPKKPSEFPKQLVNCVQDNDCPTSRNFEVRLVAGVSGGEVVELAEFFFAIKDLTNGLSSGYKLRAAGFGVGLVPISVAGGGSVSIIATALPVRVTRFGPTGVIASLVSPIPGTPGSVISRALLTLDFRPDGAAARSTLPFVIDTGPISIPGVAAHGGQLSIVGDCLGQPGAVRRQLGALDFPK